MKKENIFTRGLGHSKLRVKILLSGVTIMAVALIIFSLIAVGAVRSQNLNSLDNELATTANYLSTQSVTGNSLSSQELPSLPGSFIIVISNPANEILDNIKSVSAPNDLDLKNLLSLSKEKENYQAATIKHSGGPWRVYSQPLNNGNLLTLAVSISESNEASYQMFRMNLIIGLSMLLVMMGVTSILLSKGFEPLNKLETLAQKITAGGLDERVTGFNPKSEVGSLALAMNSMLERLESAFSDLEKAEHEAVENEEATKQFTADVSHELRTPLTSIKGFTELALLEEPDNETYQKIDQEAKRMSLLVNDLLTLARLDQSAEVNLTCVDLVAASLDALDPLIELNPDREINLHFTEGVMVKADEKAIIQILNNLIVNALHYTNGNINVTLSKTENDATIIVEDEGPGMDEQNASKAFERFHRSDVSRSRDTGGSGLGLSIVKSLVNAHGGNIILKTSVKTGSSFIITLPLSSQK